MAPFTEEMARIIKKVHETGQIEPVKIIHQDWSVAFRAVMISHQIEMNYPSEWGNSGSYDGRFSGHRQKPQPLTIQFILQMISDVFLIEGDANLE